jgi:hypothetical protein
LEADAVASPSGGGSVIPSYAQDNTYTELVVEGFKIHYTSSVIKSSFTVENLTAWFTSDFKEMKRLLPSATITTL